MTGNVWEWVADWYDATYYKSSPTESPIGSTSGEYRVVLGGSWSCQKYYLRAADRFRSTQGNRSDSRGFRCARFP